MRNTFLVLSLLTSLCGSLFAQSKLAHETRLRLHRMQPSHTVLARRPGLPAPDEYASAFITLRPGTRTDTLAALGVHINLRLDTLVTARIPVGAIPAVAALESVRYIQTGTPAHPLMNLSRNETNITALHAGTGLDSPYTGQGTVIGIVDYGFQFGHLNFYDADRSQLRIRRVWNQYDHQGTPPDGFSYGTEYATPEEILDNAYDIEDETHGTHVAGIASGADRSQSYYGAAPDAELVFVCTPGENVEICDAIQYIFRYAESVGKPCVINLSLGTHNGPHDGTSIFDRLCDQLQGESRLIAGAAGNEGSMPLHLSKTFTSDDSQITSAFHFSGPSYIRVYIWGEAGHPFQLQFFTYDPFTGQMYRTQAVDAGTETDDILFLDQVDNGYINLTTGIDAFNRRPRAIAEISIDDPGIYKTGLIITASEGTVHAWTDSEDGTFAAWGIPGWYPGDTDSTVGEIGGTGKRIISVGAYNIHAAAADDGKSAPFSSLGPTPDGRIKPDITAPGTGIISSFSNALPVLDEFSDLLTGQPTSYNGQEYYYGAISGTSMSAPMVTGILATWLQANPRLTPEDIRNILRETARSDQHTGPLLPSDTWGHGKIDAWEGIKTCLQMNTAAPIHRTAPDIALHTAPGRCELLFAASDPDVTLTLYHTGGTLIDRIPLGPVTPGCSHPLDLTGMPSGLYLLHIDGQTLHRTLKIVR